MDYSDSETREDFLRRGLSPTQIIVLAFFMIILLGTLLLCFPVASRSQRSAPFMTALFTATSATCITGLSLVDTWEQWSLFGQVIILILMEIGGLGFMSALSLVVFLFRRKVNMKQRMVMAQAIGVTDTGGIVRLQRWMLKSTFIAQGIGALILFANFVPRFGLKRSLWTAIFLSVSAYCNAGFDIMGFQTPGESLALFAGDPISLLTISALIIYGGLGFLVLEQIFRLKKFEQLNLYARMILCGTAALLVFGMLGFCLLEWNNPATLGNMNIPDKLLNGFFQSVTTRTAGFSAIAQGAMTETSKALTCVLMMIGGASSSTAGGIKVGTILVIGLFLLNRFRGRNTVVFNNRTITADQILNAMTITGVMVFLSLLGCLFISSESDVNLAAGLFESISALSNTGLSTIGTVNLDNASCLMLIVYMFFGRVGVFTISLSFLIGNRSVDRIHYPEAKLLIG